MRFVRIHFFLAALMLASVPLLADSIALRNNDHLTGTITGSDGKQVTLKTDYAGDVKIQWSAVAEVSSVTHLYVVTSDKKTINGTIGITKSVLIVHTSSGDVQVPLAELVLVRSEVDQQAYEKSLHPILLNDWTGDAAIGIAVARGNSNTTNVNLAFDADRKTLSDNIKMYASSVYAENNATVGGGVTASEVLGGARYDRNITKTLFAFVSGDFMHDALQDLNLRGIYGGGLAAHVINDSKTTFDVLGGFNYTRESYSSPPGTTPPVNITRNLGALTLGEDLNRKMGKSTVFAEQFYFYPDLSDFSQYRFSLDASAVTKIRKWLGWQVSLSDRYVSNPPIAGTKSNDIILSTGLNVQFSH